MKTLSIALLAFTLSGPAAAEPTQHAAPHTQSVPAHGQVNASAHNSTSHTTVGAAHDAHSADHHDEGIPWLKLGQHAFNLFVLIALIVKFAGHGLTDAIKNRAARMRGEITDAARLKAEAQHRFDELNARIAAFEGEVAQMQEKATSDAQKEHDAVIEQAELEAIRIVAAAKHTINDELTRARIALRNEAVELAVKLAEDTLKSNIQADDHSKLARQFLNTLSTGAQHV